MFHDGFDAQTPKPDGPRSQRQADVQQKKTSLNCCIPASEGHKGFHDYRDTVGTARNQECMARKIGETEMPLSNVKYMRYTASQCSHKQTPR